VNKYLCSNGERVSQAVIDRRRSQTYRELYEGEPHPICHGCLRRAEGSAHIIPQARAKQLGMTELCWLPINIFPSCTRCNGIAENVSSDAILELKNFETIKEVITRYDPERANKLND
jgi:hypothetical protein